MVRLLYRTEYLGFGESKREPMPEQGEWNRKGATLSDVTAKAEYGVDRDFIIKGIETEKLEYRDGTMWGNPYLRILRSQLEEYIVAEFGPDHLARVRNQSELRAIKKQISHTKKKLHALELRKKELETSVNLPAQRAGHLTAKTE